MFKTRIISACVFVPLILLATFFGGWFFTLLMSFVAIVGGYEFYNILKAKGYKFNLPLFIISALLFMAFAFMAEDYSIIILALFFLLLVIHGLLFVLQRLTIEEAAVSFFGIYYIAFTLSTMVSMRLHMEGGMFFIFLIFVIQWLTDSGAYIVGSTIGRHKLMPKISPKKSVEGAVGGVAVAVIAAVLYSLIFPVLPVGWLILMTILASVLGQLGDLVESAFKRWADVKDSGKLIPGHGGILDRFDSLLFIAPFLYIFLLFYTNYIQ
ncbi:MAG: phosphatidate cytidylyltransferase [Bacillota bacterium]|nr:phosphatidate cytidylyltransferase [Bacillota bacterium]